MVDTKNETTVEETSGEEVITTPTVEELLEELKSVKEKYHHDAEILQKVRRYEKENKRAAEAALLEQQKYKELYELEKQSKSELKNKLRDISINQQINEVIKEVDAKSPSTLIKLLDKSKFVFDEEDNLDISSVKSQLNELKKTDPILFGKEQITPPTPARSTEGTPVAGYEQELKAAIKTGKQAELDKVFKKYKII